MLGLGLGLNKGSYIKPLPKWLTDAGCTFAINVDRQVKAQANPNSPFINPLVDITKKGNNVTLQSFAGTTADGYTQIALPNGKNPWFLKFDNTDSLGIMANTADVDILGTNDFAISAVFRTAETLIGSYVFSKGDGASANQQHSLTTESNGRMLLITGGIPIEVVPAGGLVTNTLNRVLIYRKSGVLTCYLNGVLSYQSANAISITTKPNPRIGARATDATGTAHTTFTNISLGNLAIFYNGATGLDIAKVEKAVAKLNANYI